MGGWARARVWYISVSHRPHEGHAERAHRRHETNRHTAAAAHCAAPQSWSDGGRTSRQPSGDWSQQHALPQPERAAGADIGRSGRKSPSGPLSAPWQRLASVSNRWQPDWPQHKRDSIQRSQKPQQDPRGSPRRRHWSWEGRVLLCARTQPVPPPSSRSARWQCVVQEPYVLLAPTGCVARTARICHTDQQHGTPPASSPPPGWAGAASSHKPNRTLSTSSPQTTWHANQRQSWQKRYTQADACAAKSSARASTMDGRRASQPRDTRVWREPQSPGPRPVRAEGKPRDGAVAVADALKGGGGRERDGGGGRACVCVWRVLSVTFICRPFCVFVCFSR